MIENKPPKVGFVTIFGNLGETRTLVEIAKEYKELSGEVVFIGAQRFNPGVVESGRTIDIIVATSGRRSD